MKAQGDYVKGQKFSGMRVGESQVVGYLWFVRHRNDKNGRATIEVRSESSGGKLGEIRWFSKWRKYGYFPVDSTVLTEDCLNLIREAVVSL